MMKKIKISLLVVLLIVAAVVVGLRVHALKLESPAVSQPNQSVFQPGQSAGQPKQPEEPEPSESPEPTPEPKDFVLSFIGDCTLQSSPNFLKSTAGYEAIMNGDYAYPFSNTVQYFENDDFTLANLECNFSDSKLTPTYMAQLEGFYFLSPAEWTQIMTLGGVDFVTTANNHFGDFDSKGVEDTCAALETYGLPYGLEGQSQVITTDSGLKLGILTYYNKLSPKTDVAVKAIGELKAEGAEYIICMFHWGRELYYSPTEAMENTAHACIDAGANLVYGSHPHCLQPIEEYNGGIILYSMGNWSFGGSTMPSDPDTAIVQVTVTRHSDGTVENSNLSVIPCSVSSKTFVRNTNYNDYCPTPYEEGSEGYGRVLSKLDGSFQPTSQGADYSNYRNSWG